MRQQDDTQCYVEWHYKRNNMNTKHLFLVDIEREERTTYALEHSVIHFICAWNVE